jgi:hypothetical protein
LCLYLVGLTIQNHNVRYLILHIKSLWVLLELLIQIDGSVPQHKSLVSVLEGLSQLIVGLGDIVIKLVFILIFPEFEALSKHFLFAVDSGGGEDLCVEGGFGGDEAINDCFQILFH